MMEIPIARIGRIECVATGPRMSRPWFMASGRIWLAALGLPLCLASASYGQATFDIVKEFDAPFPHGAFPSGMIQTAEGSFYGTTTQGGAANAGTIFTLDAAGTLTTLYSFTGAGDGSSPGGVIQATDGSIYGTTLGGGAFNAGTIFRLDAAGTLTTLHTFRGSSDGSSPNRVIQTTDGRFYGTTLGGGGLNAGTIFTLDAAGTLTTLHRFDSSRTGSSPNALIQATDGRLYGTTLGGGFGGGTIFTLDAAGTLTTLHRFDSGSLSSDGYSPTGLIQATDGSFYGTTASGFNNNGTVFKLDAAGRLTTLHRFYGSFQSSDGYSPSGLIQATNGSFYGTTSFGGASGGGTVFTLDAGGTLTTLHHFNDTTDGSPPGRVFEATDGRFYGTTAEGGFGAGTIFTLDAAGTLTTLHRFTGRDGAFPQAGVIQATDGRFYGTTPAGGTYGRGTLFTLDGTGTLTTLHSFTGPDGAVPRTGVIQATDGSFYGTTSAGGTANAGTFFKFDAAGTLTTLHSFSSGLGRPSGVIQAMDGNFYGRSAGGAAVFKLDAAGILTTLCRNCTPGDLPELQSDNGLIQATDGSFYGTTRTGGPDHAGTIFSVGAAGGVAILYSFSFEVCCNANGQSPNGVIQGIDGNLYGTTLGSVFKLDPARRLTTLHRFPAVSDGSAGGLIQAMDGNIYGTTSPVSGTTGSGTFFRLDAAGTVTALHRFPGSVGAFPRWGGLIQAADGSFYGTTSTGGAANAGTVFRLTLSVNQAPVSAGQSTTTLEDTATGLTLTATDADGDPLTFAVETGPAHGALTGAAPNVTYTPAAHYHGTDSFTFTAHDGTAASAPATVSITVTPVNDPPVAADGTAYTTRRKPVDGTLVAADVDHSQLTYALVTTGTKGTAVITDPTTGAYTYTPRGGQRGTDAFTFTASDGAALSNLGTITVVIAAVRPTPHPLPGRIEAEHYDLGGPGIGYVDTTPGNEQGLVVYRADDVDIKVSAEGGYAIGWFAAGEWLAYTVRVARPGVYTLQARVGSALDGRTFHVQVDGQDVTGPIAVPLADDWDRYATIRVPGVRLPAGIHVLRVVMGPEDSMDLQWIAVVPGRSP